ncbi:pseudouridine synthase [Thermicanus aegyptius]|uniref:pseudouridine synthase n=1 Tax=Thermicanus aegyptius TaxID=94009 RepID=UPI000425B3D4|nr:pseudouridine synthase [Thermicanus aegyptius]
MERLQKVMAERGVASRRVCEEMIRKGRVKVNGKVITELGTRVDPLHDHIEVDGKPIPQKEKRVYILLYKPAGVMTTVKDPEGRRTVMELIAGLKERVYPVGRLDYETEGALLLTNDGELAYRLIHPRFEVEKEYLVHVEGIPSPYALDQLENGVILEDGVTSPAKLSVLKKDKRGTWLTLTIHEGRNRMVRRMCAAVGHPVLYLRRVRISFLTLEGLKKGEYRHLTDEEVAKLRRITRDR